MKAKEIRQKYLDFFKSKGHKIIPSASLLPENDPTTLFTGSGMQPMVPYLLGETHPEGTRIVDSQKCFRAGDIDDVGDNRHTTFFEMLGNWSLGDYFKKEQIDWMFKFLTKELNLDPSRLYISVYRGNEKYKLKKDEEAVAIWQEKFKSIDIDAKAVDFAEKNGIQDGKIFYYPEKENWWSRVGVPENMPEGEPGGPDSEMFWDFGAELKLHENSEWKDKPCHPACDCGRFLEIGNNVFMQFIKTKDGFDELKNKNIDFGGGLERLAVAVNDTPDIFLSDIFESLRNKIEITTGKKYGENENQTKAFRVIMDHLRGATFLIADGAIPSNKDQGYFTRRLIRRAVRFAHNLDVNSNFTADVAEVVINEYQDYYTELKNKRDIILSEITKEEDKFRKTLETGLKEFKKLKIDPDKENNGIKIYHPENDDLSKEYIPLKRNGALLFDLYQTFGFPFEMSIEEIENKTGEKLNNWQIKDFKKQFDFNSKQHQELSRTASAGKFKGGLADNGEETARLHTATHLLNASLRKVLGDHVYQKGSNITAERLRFDFTHNEKLTDEEKVEVEELVNKAIQDDLPISFEEMSVEEAKEKGAIGVFDSKYDQKVKVYKVGDNDNIFSMEICGGPHVKSTGELGSFKIKKEQSSSAGVRRIKGILK
jgi:alanyl-tRNA synthetase